MLKKIKEVTENNKERIEHNEKINVKKITEILKSKVIEIKTNKPQWMG